MKNPDPDTLAPVAWDELKDGDICYIDNSDIHTARPPILGPYRVIEPGSLYRTKRLILAEHFAKEPYYRNRLRTFEPGQREINRLKKIK